MSDVFKRLEEEIVHFRRIGVHLNDDKLKELREKIEKVKEYPQKKEKEQKLHELYGEISPEEYDKKKSEIEKRSRFQPKFTP